jgi:S1-C subfamily serine protease
MRSLLATVAICLLAASASAKGPFGTIKVGGWSGGAYTDNNTGTFSHCAVAGKYRSGIAVIVFLNNQRNWRIGFVSADFSFSTGSVFPIDVTFDGQDQIHLYGEAVDSHGAAADLSKVAILEFRKAHLMGVEMKGGTYRFDLTMTDKMAATLENCVTTTQALGVDKVGNFSLPVSNPPNTAPVSDPTKQSQNAKTFVQNGTGFVVSASGHVITNHHVIAGCVGDIRGNLTAESPSTLRVVSTDETNDLALLQADKTFNDAATIRAGPIHPGDTIIAIGFPYHGLFTSDFTVSSGIVSSLSGLLNDTRYLQISAGVQTGNSGGPLLDTSGNVVGVVAAKLNAIKFAKVTGDLPQNINFAVKTGAVRDFLDNSAVAYRTAESVTELKTADIASKARAYTMLISCTAKEKD